MLLLKLGALTYLAVGAMLYLGQRSLMYLPTSPNSAEDRLSETIPVAGARLKVWVINPGRSHALLYFGGNAEDVYYQADEFAQHLPGHTSYLINYRGYGGSTGKPTESVLFADALELFDRLSERHDSLDVVGRSLGSGVAVYLASRRPVDRIVLVSAFDSLRAVAQRHYPVFPVGWLLKDRYESDRHAADVTSPVRLLVAENDRIIPVLHAERLATAFTQAPVDRVVIDDAGHNDISHHRRYWEALAEFLDRPVFGG